MTYYKAIRPNGTDFFSGKVRWAPADEPAVPDSVVRHPTATEVGPEADRYLSASTVATDCTGMRWPCRLLEVEPVDAHGRVIEPVTPGPYEMPNKRAAVRWRVVRELPAHEALGPQGEQFVSLLERVSWLTDAEVAMLAAQCAQVPSDAWRASWRAARASGRAAAWSVIFQPRNVTKFGASARVLVINAAQTLLLSDRIGQHGFTQEHYDVLAGPWRYIHRTL